MFVLDTIDSENSNVVSRKREYCYHLPLVEVVCAELGSCVDREISNLHRQSFE